MGLFDFFKSKSNNTGFESQSSNNDSNSESRKTRDGYVARIFVLHEKKISVSAKIDESDPSKVLTNMYSYAMGPNGKMELQCRDDIEEFFEQIQIQINYLESRTLDPKSLGPYFDAFATGCLAHIKKYGRIIITDLWSQVNYTLWIVKATTGVFHNVLNSDDEWLSYREFLINEGSQLLFDYLWIPHPNGQLDKNGMLKIVKATEAYN